MSFGLRIAAFMIAATVSADGVLAAGQLPTLDLTDRPAPIHAAERRSVQGVVAGEPVVVAGGTAGIPEKPLGLHVALKLEPAQRWGEPFFYELEIQNASQSAILVPWSVSIQTIPSERAARESGYRKLSVALHAHLGQDVLLVEDTADEIAGFRDQPNTVRLVKPGERFVIRGKGRWAFLAETDAAKSLAAQLPRNLSVQAVVSLSRWPSLPGPRASSTPIQVSIQP